MKKKIIITAGTLILLTIAGGVFYGYKTNRLPKFWQKTPPVIEEKLIDITMEAGNFKQDFSVPENSTLLEVMMNLRLAGAWDFIARSTDDGLKVESINNKETNTASGKHWVCVVNGNKTIEKIFDYKVQNGDIFVWKIQ